MLALGFGGSEMARVRVSNSLSGSGGTTSAHATLTRCWTPIRARVVRARGEVWVRIGGGGSVRVRVRFSGRVTGFESRLVMVFELALGFAFELMVELG